MASRSACTRILHRSTNTFTRLCRLKLKNRHEEARQILEQLHPGDQDEVNKEVKDIELALQMSANHASLKSKIHNPLRWLTKTCYSRVSGNILHPRDLCRGGREVKHEVTGNACTAANSILCHMQLQDWNPRFARGAVALDRGITSALTVMWTLRLWE